MGLFTGIKAMNAVKKIKNGGTAKISYSMISMLLVNLPEAKAKLSTEEFKQVEKLFLDFKNANTLFEVDKDGYLALCEEVIKKYDRIAPYELYSGGNELEFSMMMDELRSEDTQKKERVKEAQRDVVDSFEVDESTIQTIMVNSPFLQREDAVEFYRVMVENSINGKTAALERFDRNAKKLIETDRQRAFFVVSFLCGLLEPTGIVTHDESNNLSKKYSDLIINAMTSNNGK